MKKELKFNKERQMKIACGRKSCYYWDPCFRTAQDCSGTIDMKPGVELCEKYIPVKS